MTENSVEPWIQLRQSISDAPLERLADRAPLAACHVLAHDSSAGSFVVGAGPDGQLPKPLQTMDPSILELVCAEVVEEGAQV